MKASRRATEGASEREAQRCIADMKKTTEATTVSFCAELSTKWVKLWDERSEALRSHCPVDTEGPPPAPVDPAVQRQGTSTANVLVPYDDEELMHALTVAERDALDWIDQLKDVELWLTLHAASLEPPQSFGQTLQSDALLFIGHFIGFISTNVYSMKANYLKQKVLIETSIVQYKYKPSDIPAFEACANHTWFNLQYAYRALRHRSLLLYKILSNNEATLRKPKPTTVAL
eukprot:TRINITY_DN37589_c0_g1_i1.p1 TRINITY_DN37589_c0_g1~~TRINITY_DN37589_c0_g1_i1.p1  ORF type:complete len:254 (+),score=46.44 TRINITY_DN37589_c0_g1_i1:71-763(+)